MRAYLACLVFLVVPIGAGFPAHADTFVLANGDKLTGDVVAWAVDHVVIEHEQLGTLRLELDQLKLDTGEPPNPGLFGTRFLRGWSRRVDVGITGEWDDDPTGNITVGTKLRYRDPWTRWRVNGRYYYSFSDDIDDRDNNATFDLTRDWLIPESRWFGSLAGRYQFDQFQAWEHRLTIFGGPGLHLVDTETHTLDVRLGPGFTRELGTSNDNKAEIVLPVNYDWKISERQSLELANQYFLQYTPDAGEWRNFTTFNWSLKLTERPALSLNIGLQNEYESDPDAGDPNNDLKYFLTLGVDL